ncbi:MAG: tetratricopeptide repeat protein [Candidatus Omnitrophica bacterium]|nr:tetratricopeptide repeat protein [Candidatus Omnitrophota bacterium]
MFRQICVILVVLLVAPAGVFAASQEDKDAILQEIGNFIDKDPAVIGGVVSAILDDYERLGNIDKTIAFYKKALKILPGDAMIVTRFADRLSDWRRWDEAIEQYRRAQVLEQHNLWHSMRVADLLVVRERYDEAKKVLDGIVAQAQDDWNRSQAQERLANIADKVTIEEVKAVKIEPAPESKPEPEPEPEIKKEPEEKAEPAPESIPKKKKKKRGWFFGR